MTCLDLARYLVTWMIMQPAMCSVLRRCVRMYVKLWAEWLEPPRAESAPAVGAAAVPNPPFAQARGILSQFMLRERLKMKLSDAPWKMYDPPFPQFFCNILSRHVNASLVIHNFLFIGAGNCSVSPILLTQPPCADDSGSTEYAFHHRRAMLKQFYDANNIRFIVNVSGRDEFMRSAEYPISANRTYSAAETSDLFTNLADQPFEMLQPLLNGDHVTVFLVHMEDVEHWPQLQVSSDSSSRAPHIASHSRHIRAWRWTALQLA